MVEYTTGMVMLPITRDYEVTPRWEPNGNGFTIHGGIGYICIWVSSVTIPAAEVCSVPVYVNDCEEDYIIRGVCIVQQAEPSGKTCAL